ncbi:MAG: DNA repair protein RecO [Anaerolineales bacterium]|nr:DNA repair protein RecO [Anaerolineales bacterium]
MPRQERVYRTEGVVLRRQDLGETDRLTTVYTLQYGKLRVVAKGVRKPRSRKAGHLEPFTQVALMLAKGRELDLITQAEAIETFPQVKDDLKRLGQASYVVELLDRFSVVEGEANQRLYRILIDTLNRLAAKEIDPSKVILYFEMRLLDEAGYRPELFHCLVCRTEIRAEDQFFSSKQGGVLCRMCGTANKDTRPITLGALKVIRHYQRSNFSTAASPHVPSATFTEVEQIMEDYMSYLLERRLNSPSFLRRISYLENMDDRRP